ncbi:Asp-tRNA(Asn)/Glu-tRNA(Gln) amidotransferase subunit GatA [Candidatus Pacearchaeota archaeon]|nr:Asp-tRNA(Asn)/Glu-tRNA(Gln) amidotransferase subunit GatA [Candidatus Pacearchaeota archaeon]MBD3283547.1 Asp-tRNA(Asn)/Glu-tRNA(Gln) amidotransferase subunit GatA [Candidatus Pacearchaeota archaeon]
MIKQKLKLIKEGKLTAEHNIRDYIEKIRKENPEMNIVLHINENAIEQAVELDKKIKQGEAGKLAGLGFLVKSVINVEGLICNCSSRVLENYKATYNATVIEKLLEEDAIVLGMVNCDEFACGATGEHSAFGVCKNPRSPKRVPGGSSSGSAAGVTAGFCDFSLGSDTGGSIRNPASHCGIVGFKPSYGKVSRYGLIDLAMSFDQIGPLAENIEDCRIVFDVIKGRDSRDTVTMDFKEKKNKKKISIGVPKINADEKIWKKIRGEIGRVCKENSWTWKDIEIKHIDLGIQTYYPIVYTEFFSGTRKFDGRKYGFKIEDACGEEVLRRILGGKEITKAEYAGRYYRKALAVRKILKQEFEKAFKKFDVLVMPTVPKLPHQIGEKISVEENYMYDACTVLANICEIPAISVPAGEIDGIPVGIQILAEKGEDDFLLDVAGEFEK